MDVSQLRTLIYVAEFGSLSKAADRLCIAQPALSRHVRLLEEELGTRLFDRHGRGMALTDQGRAVVQHARRIMSEFQDIRTSVAAQNGELAGRVSIGLPPTVSQVLTVPLVTSLRDEYPDIVCRVVTGFTGYLFDWISSGDLDIIVIYDPHAIRSLKSEPLVEEPFYLVGPANAGLTHDQPVEFASLAGRPMILPSSHQSLRQISEIAAHAAGITLEVAVEADSYTALKQFVQSGCGWSFLPIAPIRDDIAAGRLSAAPLVYPTPKRELVMSVSADRQVSRLTAVVQNAITATTSRLVRSGEWTAAKRLTK